MFDVIVVGAGPAGLQAALTLGRVRRQTLLCDSGTPRGGLDPAGLCRIARQELRRYLSVEVRSGTITTVRKAGDAFRVTLADGAAESARKLILATGVVDDLPPLNGLAELWGRAAFHCARSDGCEHADQRIVVIDGGSAGAAFALQLGRWHDEVVLATNGADGLTEQNRARLSAQGITLREEPIERLEPDGDAARIIFAEGAALDRRTLFLHPATRQRSDLAAQLGCATLLDGSIEVNDFAQTSVPGLFAVGDMARRPSQPQARVPVVHAAASGGMAAVVAHGELAGRERRSPLTRVTASRARRWPAIGESPGTARRA